MKDTARVLMTSSWFSRWPPCRPQQRGQGGRDRHQTWFYEDLFWLDGMKNAFELNEWTKYWPMHFYKHPVGAHDTDQSLQTLCTPACMYQ